MLKIDTSGLDKLKKKFEQLADNASRLNGTHSVPLSELLNPKFMATHTKFATVDEMFAASGYEINSREDLDRIPEGPWDDFIKSVSQFGDWRSMMDAAVRAWTAGKLGL